MCTRTWYPQAELLTVVEKITPKSTLTLFAGSAGKHPQSCRLIQVVPNRQEFLEGLAKPRHKLSHSCQEHSSR